MSTMSFISGDIGAHVNIELTVAEIHNLAYFYHWGRDECWNLPCTERGVFNDKIRQQLKAESKGGKNSGTPRNPLKEYRESN